MKLITLLLSTYGHIKPYLANFQEKNSRLDLDSKPGLQLYALALYKLNPPEDLLGQARMFALISNSLYLRTGPSAIYGWRVDG